MPAFSQKSKDKLATCHADLQRLMNEVIKETDITILEGHRNQSDQEADFAKGTTELHYPHGRHNAIPSLAVDIAPYPIDFNNIQRFKDLSVTVRRIAQELGISILWGGDAWKTLKDFPHYELTNLTGDK